jgi:hypothetical protein
VSARAAARLACALTSLQSRTAVGQGRDPGRAEAAFLLQCTAHDPSPDDEEGGEMDERRKGDKSTPLPVQGG